MVKGDTLVSGTSYGPETGIIYILTNVYMPGLVKIGRTTPGRGRQRVTELFTTGVPVPFNVEFAAYVRGPQETEGRVHTDLKHARVHPNREYFEIDPDAAKAKLMPYALGDATPELLAIQGEEIDLLSLDAGRRSSRRSDMDFFRMGLRAGDELTEQESGAKAYVEDRHTVYYRGQHGQTLNGIYKMIHGKRKPGTWVTSDKTRVSWLFYNVQHGNEPPPWNRSRPTYDDFPGPG